MQNTVNREKNNYRSSSIGGFRLMAISVAAIVITLMLVLSFSRAVYAAEEIDSDAPVILTGKFHGDAATVPGIELDAHKIADMAGEGDFQVDETFAAYDVDFSRLENQLDWRSLGETLSGYIERDGIEADYVAITDESGTASFGQVEPGLYLVIGSPYYVYDYESYSVGMSLVTAPQLEDGAWNSDVVFSPKYTTGVFPPPELPETPGLKVLKIWEDGGETGATEPETRPDSIEVELICDGEIIDTVTLNKENGWQHEWVIDPEKTYHVTEKNVPEGYKVSIARENDVVAVTNTYVPPETPPENPVTPNTPEKPSTPSTPTTPTRIPPTLPYTGLPWIPAIILGSVGLVFLVGGIIRRRTA